MPRQPPITTVDVDGGVSVKLPRDLYDKVRAIGLRDLRTISAVLRLAVDAYENGTK